MPALVEGARKLDQMRGVIGALHAAAHHLVIARVLAFEPQPPAGDPEQRIEPVERAQQLRGELHDPVAAADVRELVRQHDARALVRPRIRPPTGRITFGRASPHVTSSEGWSLCSSTTGRRSP